MKQLAKVSAWAGLASGVIGGLSRLAITPIVLPSRGWAGISIILLLFSIALALNYEK